LKKAGVYQQRLNKDERPIANKYCEGKVKKDFGKKVKRT